MEMGALTKILDCDWQVHSKNVIPVTANKKYVPGRFNKLECTKKIFRAFLIM